jgi:molybdate transport system substrate-binding protein
MSLFPLPVFDRDPAREFNPARRARVLAGRAASAIVVASATVGGGRMLRDWRRAFAAAMALAACASAQAETVTVAVASNFSVPLALIGPDFERSTGHELRIVSGSTGRLYAQIVNGAPYDVFLAADAERPRRLEAEALAVADSRFTYAEGILVLWSADPANEARGCLAALDPGATGRVAIANPAIAPYGRAARAFLEGRGLWQAVEGRIVTGENVSQVAQFVASRNADLGFIAKSQLVASPLGRPTCVHEIAPGTHPPIEQQAVRLVRSADNPAAAAFVDFMKSDGVRKELVVLGYRAIGQVH